MLYKKQVLFDLYILDLYGPYQYVIKYIIIILIHLYILCPSRSTSLMTSCILIICHTHALSPYIDICPLLPVPRSTATNFSNLNCLWATDWSQPAHSAVIDDAGAAAVQRQKETNVASKITRDKDARIRNMRSFFLIIESGMTIGTIDDSKYFIELATLTRTRNLIYFLIKKKFKSMKRNELILHTMTFEGHTPVSANDINQRILFSISTRQERRS